LFSSPVAFFFGTLFVLDHRIYRTDDIRRADALRLKQASSKYRLALGKYPSPYGGGPITALEKDLVGGKFIQALPVDPEAGKIPNFNYSYVSVKDGSGKIAAGSPCITGDGIAETNWWGQP
jgi:hypothetical protein